MDRYCHKCSKMATIKIKERYYCSLHGLEAEAAVFPELLKKKEQELIVPARNHSAK